MLNTKSSLILSASLMILSPTYAQVKIGVSGPMSGTNQAKGNQLKNGAELAVSDINEAGGMLGQKIELIIADDKSDPSEGIKVATKFSNDSVKFVVGHYNSGVSIPASDVYSESGMLMVSPSSTNPLLTERGLWNTFRTCGRDDQRGAVAAEYIEKMFKGKKVAIAHDRTTYGQGLANETRKSFNTKSVKEVLFEGVNPSEKNYSALVQSIKASEADIFFWGGTNQDAGLIVKEMREQGLKTVLMGGDGTAPEQFASIGGDGVVGSLMIHAPDARLRPEAKSTVAKFVAKNINPEFYTLYSYATVQVMAQAAKRVNSLEPKKISAEMRNGKPYKTVIGDISFNMKGDVTRHDYVIYTWKKVGDKISPVQQ
jgi:branched-chain amino acid transport system substrate-binding protein